MSLEPITARERLLTAVAYEQRDSTVGRALNALDNRAAVC